MVTHFNCGYKKKYRISVSFFGGKFGSHVFRMVSNCQNKLEYMTFVTFFLGLILWVLFSVVAKERTDTHFK